MTEEGAQSSGSSNENSNSKKAAGPVPVIACLACRSRKIRCEKSDVAPDRCKRCFVTNSVCQYQVHHRGKTLDGRVDLRKHRKRKQPDGTPNAEEQQQQQQPPKPAPSNSSKGTYSAGDALNSPSLVDYGRSRQVPYFPPPQSSSGSSDGDFRFNHQSPSLLAAMGGSSSSSRMPRPKPLHDLKDAFVNTESLEEHSAAIQGTNDQRLGSAGEGSSRQGGADGNADGQHHSFTVAPNIRSDAYANKIVTWEHLEAMFTTYIRHLDPHAGLLDPDLHTASYTRNKYPLTFSAVTTLSAMVRQESVYPAMAKILEGLDAYATLSEQNSLDRLLAKTSMLMWGIFEGKHSRNGRSRLYRVNQLLTDAIGLSLHISRSETESDPIVWRENALRRRTWVQLCLIFQTYQTDVNQQADYVLGKRVPTADSFLAECSQNEITTADYRLICSLEMVALRCEITQIARVLHQQDSSSVPSIFLDLEPRLAGIHQKLTVSFRKWFIQDGEEIYARGKLDYPSAKDMCFMHQASQFYLNQVTWLWASCIDSSRDEASNYNAGASDPSPKNSDYQSHHTFDDSTSMLMRDEIHWFTQCQITALHVLTTLDKMKDEEFKLSMDFVFVTASKISLWISRYSVWFSATFLQDTRRVMSSLTSRSLAAIPRRGNTLRCFAGLMENIVQWLPTGAADESIQLTSGQNLPQFPHHLLDRAPGGGHTGGDGVGYSGLSPVAHHSSQSPADGSHTNYILPSQYNNNNNYNNGSSNNMNTPGAVGGAGTDADLVRLREPWQRPQHQNHNPHMTTTRPTNDLWQFLDMEDLRHWEELFGIDLQLGRSQSQVTSHSQV